MRRRPERNLPTVGFDQVHDEGGNKDDDERSRSEPCRGIVDVAGPDMPNEETEGEETESDDRNRQGEKDQHRPEKGVEQPQDDGSGKDGHPVIEGDTRDNVGNHKERCTVDDPFDDELCHFILPDPLIGHAAKTGAPLASQPYHNYRGMAMVKEPGRTSLNDLP